ncbi:MAG: hypothetical protein IPO48_00055 [Saprospiraceae bacterium]|nr:hypothetical protein [Saprospiraceae bacterium]
MNGVKMENFNFILVTEKYLQGITDEQLDFKIRVAIYTILDSFKRKVDVFVLKTNKSKQNYIDFVSWIQDENPINLNDRSKPYVIHPITGKLVRIREGIVIRYILENNHADKLMNNALEIEEWNEFHWEESSIINFSISLNIDPLKTYYGNCNSTIPKTIFKTLNNFGIK